MRIKRHPTCLLLGLLTSLLFCLPDASALQGNIQRVIPLPGSVEKQRQRALERQYENRARRFEDRADYERALDLWRQLLDMDSTRVDYYDGIRRNLVSLARYDQAKGLILERLKSGQDWENSGSRYAELGEVRMLEGDSSGAAEAFEQAISKGEWSSGYHAVATVLARNRRLDEAIAVLRRARVDLKEPHLFASTLAPLLKSRMDWQGAAEEYLLTARESSSSARFAIRGLAAIPPGEGEDAAIEAISRELESQSTGEEPWPGYTQSLLEAWAARLKEAGDFTSALEVVTRIDSLNDIPGQPLVRFAAEVMGEGEEEVARIALERAAKRLKDYHGLGVVDLARADLAQRRGLYPVADSLYSAILENPTSPEIESRTRINRGWMRLMMLHQPKQAAEDFRVLIKQNQMDVRAEARRGLATSLAMMDSLDAAMGILSQPMRGEPEGFQTPVPQGDVVAGMLAARIALWQGNTTRAAGLLEWVLTPPKGTQAENEAFALLRVLNSNPDTTALQKFAEADKGQLLSDTTLSRQLYREIMTSTDGALADEAAWRLAMMDLNAGEPGTMRSLATSENVSPRSTEAWLTLAQWYADAGEYEQAVHALEELLLTDPYGPFSGIARVRLDRLQAELVVKNP